MITTLRRAMRFPAAERRALVVAAVLQVIAGVALRLAPVGAIAHAAGRLGGRRRRDADIDAAHRWLWALDASGRHLGRASSCLARAVAAQWSARRCGIALPISIGVVRGADGSLAAHAWIAAPGGLRLGADRAGGYVPLATLEGAPPV